MLFPLAFLAALCGLRCKKPKTKKSPLKKAVKTDTLNSVYYKAHNQPTYF
uniref:Uncharacterized protein n=2 Tax=Gammaproteobacteria TaxID=1236 RepID=A0A514C8S9_MORMO|nr:hypothetical protein [Morganella morganii]QDX15387.1 hypothetical protein [Actinobacillus pleuropneumoniae]